MLWLLLRVLLAQPFQLTLPILLPLLLLLLLIVVVVVQST